MNGGMHKSITEPPSSTMFNRAGGAPTSASKKGDAVTEAASQMTVALTSKLAAAPPTKTNSPAEIIDNRSKCYHQLGEPLVRSEVYKGV